MVAKIIMESETEHIYERLRQHFNQGETTKLRKTKELMEILEILFSPEQVDYATDLPLTVLGRISAENLAKKMDKDALQVEVMLENMAGEGKILATTSRKDGKKYYSLFPLIPGILESTYADGIDNDQRQRLSALVEKYHGDALGPEIGSSKYPIFRIIPINEKVDSGSQALPFEEAANMVNGADVITVIPCLCRTVSKKCNHIMEADFVFGAWADYLIKYRGARKWTKEEAMKRLKECEEDGLLHITGNAQEGSAVMCNCCPCCCNALRNLTEHHNPRAFVRSNFEPRVDHEMCILCMQCQDVCPMGAIRELPGYEADGSDTRMFVEESQCVGCGLCSSHCPADAIRMVKVRNYLPVKSLAEMNAQFFKEKIL